ncbi:MAG: hypothetical protein JWQ52_55 [Phenylobacterium sp.]|jgi:hypothetical protein|nr:hypothetical protein [Phenylobacterium sp.]
MRVEKPTPVQILLAWRDNKWIVSRNAVEVGAYAYRAHAMEMARRLSTEAADQGLGCYMLVREPDGSWEERRCPPPGRDHTPG